VKTSLGASLSGASTYKNLETFKLNGPNVVFSYAVSYFIKWKQIILVIVMKMKLQYDSMYNSINSRFQTYCYLN
jgi:hypothetical protein